VIGGEAEVIRSATIALAALMASSIGLVLLAGYASVLSDRSYYAYGDIEAKNEPINIIVHPVKVSMSAGSQGVKKDLLMTIVAQDDVENLKLLVRWVDAAQIARYFDYINIILFGEDGQIKGMLTPRKPTAMITIDHDDILSGNNDGVPGYNITAVIYYEVKEGYLFSDLPLVFNVKLLQTS